MDKEEHKRGGDTMAYGGTKSHHHHHQQQRVVLTSSQREALGEAVAAQIDALNASIELLEGKNASMEGELSSLKATEEKLRTQLGEAVHRERVYARRLTNKDQEIQELMAQLSELKAAQAPGPASIRSAFLDPAVNMLIARLRQEVATLKTRLEETQSELSAWKFTPDSNTGKRLMAKCRLLYQENEELGRIVSSGRLAKLEGDLALQKRLSEEVKRSQSELDEILQDLDEDVEGMQGTIYILQQELRKSKEESRVGSRTNGGNNSRPSADIVTADNSNDAPVSMTNGNSSSAVIRDDNDSDHRTRSQSSPPSPDKRTQSDLINRKLSRSSSPSYSSEMPVKKRRTSELSLDYNEDDDVAVTNGDIKLEDSS